ncbi:hypothetical protein LOCC1_G002006 [Lachnellula occidentalis]|uniref:DNase1 protein n=1 Tax=Lachnellula occidentalis TaxID=215460 RepID=A0A8H8S2K8_9HELO|nr:hypothetical protein LOCC1_G002006 [Lachnellula occidentalis]
MGTHGELPVRDSSPYCLYDTKQNTRPVNQNPHSPNDYTHILDLKYYSPSQIDQLDRTTYVVLSPYSQTEPPNNQPNNKAIKMQFTSTLLLAASALATLATANSVQFVNQDSTDRTIYFTATAGGAYIPALAVSGLATEVASFPDSWIGNWHSVSSGAENVTGMLGEVAWNGFSGSNFFDVSAIVNPDDNQGVKQIYPKSSTTPMSGCQTFPCTNAYNKPDDVATLSTEEADLVCLIGNIANERRHARDFVERK